MSDSNFTSFLDKYHFHLVVILIVIIFIALFMDYFHIGEDTQSKIHAWFEKPLSSADLGDLFMLFFLHAMWNRRV